MSGKTVSEQLMRPTDAARYHQTRRVTLVGAGANLLLASLQILIGITGRSQALIADGLHTLSDLLSDGIVLLAAKQAHQAADDEHPYGHGRIETVATVALGLSLTGVAVGIGMDSFSRLLDSERQLQPELMTLAIALLGILLKEGLYHYTRIIADRIGSPMLRANAWHHRSDALSSVIVLIGIGGTLLGFAFFDAVAALLVALLILNMGWKLIWESVRELIDTAFDEERVQEIRRAIEESDGVTSLHMLRSRGMAGEALVDVHIQVSPRISVSEGHRIADSVERGLIERFSEVRDVIVHIDPEDDEQAATCVGLPLRTELAQQLAEQWRDLPLSNRIEGLELHYLDGRIDLQIILPIDPLSSTDQAAAISAAYADASRQISHVGDVQVLFRARPG